MAGRKERFLKQNSPNRSMAEKEVAMRPSGLSVLSPEQLVEYEGKCLGIVNGKVKFVNEDANTVVKALLAEKSPDKVFTSIPLSNVALVK